MTILIKGEQVDLLDLELIKLLRVDARRSNADLARRLHTSTATVRRRINRLTESGTIGIVALPNPTKFGFLTEALICLKAVNSQVDNIVQSLSEKEETVWVAITGGRFDIICNVRVNDSNALSHFLKADLAEIEGITMTETIILLEVAYTVVDNTGRK